MSTNATRRIVSSEGTRIRVSSPLSFETVSEALLAQMGKVLVPEFMAFVAEVKTAEDFDRIVSERWVGESGFMQFAVLSHSGWLPLYGINRRAERWILGNPLIAITMIKHDISAGLFAPVELLLTDNEDKNGCTIDYVLPSSMIAPAGCSDALRAAANILDQKFEALVARASGLK
ncbi:DUF302 domain-containing protein [Phenylobacterium immobile]|uniref:DUF302 domain-containing protein n=1 Tax=Phenylobacterium immobile TaxID=21 RepID=UPI000AF0A601|nr:DUF302 domain-containing protein [Phenylobacterium immobile]